MGERKNTGVAQKWAMVEQIKQRCPALQDIVGAKYGKAARKSFFVAAKIDVLEKIMELITQGRSPEEIVDSVADSIVVSSSQDGGPSHAPKQVKERRVESAPDKQVIADPFSPTGESVITVGKPTVTEDKKPDKKEAAKPHPESTDLFDSICKELGISRGLPIATRIAQLKYLATAGKLAISASDKISVEGAIQDIDNIVRKMMVTIMDDHDKIIRLLERLETIISGRKPDTDNPSEDSTERRNLLIKKLVSFGYKEEDIVNSSDDDLEKLLLTALGVPLEHDIFDS